MGLDIRAQLLSRRLLEFEVSGNLRHLLHAVEVAVPTAMSEHDAVALAVKHLQVELDDGKAKADNREKQESASVRLLDYLWQSEGNRAEATARQVPLLTSNGHIVRWTAERLMVAPVGDWHEAARPFATAYPPDRILADLYSEDAAAALPDVVNALVQWGIAIPDLIWTDTPTELKDRRLGAISTNAEVDGIVVSRTRLSQIALLPDVLLRCQENVDEARALLGLVLCYVAPNDGSWRSTIAAQGRKAGEDISLEIRGALWLADLKFRAWVPVPGEDGKPAKMLASAATLKDLLNPEWLADNDAAISLLSDCFEFDALELRLLGVAPDDELRSELRNSLAKLVEWGGADPQVYETLQQDVEARRNRERDVNRYRRLGLAVQDAIKRSMEGYGLELELVDRGFDYEVTKAAADILADGAYELEIGPYLLEVKATTSGGARLTPQQAQTAADEAQRYAVCVVDLRGCSPNELDQDNWDPERVEQLARIVSDIGLRVEETCDLVQAARTTEVGIRNESSLRYEVPMDVWQAGSTISDWVSAAFPNADRIGTDAK
jgi:hypothetical protein